MEGRSLAALKKGPEALAAIKAAPALAGSNKDLEAEAALRSAEILLESEKPADALEYYRILAANFATLPATVPALDSAIARMYSGKHDAETVELADLFLSAAPANSPKRAAVARMKSRSLSAQKKTAEATDAARLAVREASGLTDAAARNEEYPASAMLLAELSPAETPGIFKEVIEKYAQTRFAFDAQYELARIAGEAGKIDDALTSIESLLAAIEKAPAGTNVAEKLKHDALFAAGEFAFHKPDYKKLTEYSSAFQKTYGAKDEHADDVVRKLAWGFVSNRRRARRDCRT